MIEITVISYIPITPSPTTVNISPNAIIPVATPTIKEITVPPISTTNTFTPTSAPTKTRIYGIICQKLYV